MIWKKLIALSLLTIFFLIRIDGGISLISSQKGPLNQAFSPACLCWSDELNALMVLEATANRIDLLNLPDGNVIHGDSFDGMPTGICLGHNSIFVTTDYDNGTVHTLDPVKLTETGTFRAGPGARSPGFIKSRGIISICHTWMDELGFYSLPDGELIKTIPVLKQPYTSVLSPDEKYLFVANFITHQRADQDTVAASVSVINLEKLEVEKHLLMANGSNALRGMAVSSNGEFVLISHNLGRFQVPTTQLEQGWMNTSALSIIKISDLSYEGTILLDEPEHGAAGSWGIDCHDGIIAVAHSGTHDVSVIDEKKFFTKLRSFDNRETLSYDLNFLSGIRKRITLPGNGPRALLANDTSLYLGMYFSDTVNQVLLSENEYEVRSWPLNDGFIESRERLGEKYFHDATYCFQGWQACNGCHPMDARTDGLNWDLLNDGVGNPKNCKSLLASHVTPPSMITGIRPDAETAVRAGFKYIQFARIPEEYSLAVDAYLKSLKPVPSPYLERGRLSDQAKRGEKIYHQKGCQECHPKPYYTDLKMHTVTSPTDTLGPQLWDTPALIEVWRTGPWMHDGRCASMYNVFDSEQHGLTEDLSESDMNDLVKYVLSL